MTEPTVAAELDRIEARYRNRFAGHARVTRDPEELEDLLKELDGLRARATGEDAARLERDLTLYRNEVEAIRQAHAVPGAVPAARVRMWADLVLQRYQRSFAGQDRRTRDATLLEELRDELVRLKNDMATLHKQAPEQGLQAAIATVDRSKKLYDDEIEAIRAARRTGNLGDQGSRFATLANEQFAAYGRLFAGESRVSRHAPALLRIVHALEEIHKGMRSLRLAGMKDSSNDKNQDIVQSRIDQYRKEYQAIVSAQRDTSTADRISALATAANKVFATYRERFANKARADVDPDELNGLGERLWCLACEMDAVDRQHGDERNERNLRIVTDNLALYHREWDAIRQARPATPASEPPPRVVPRTIRPT